MSNPRATNGIFVNGEWLDLDITETVESRNPAEPEQVVAEFPAAEREHAQEAVQAAVDAQDSWEATNQHERGSYLRDAADVLEERFDEISALLVREMGKTITSAEGEVQRAIDIFNYYAEVARDNDGVTRPSAQENTLAYTTREPWGTTAVITPWNFPFAIPAWKIAPALATGNTVVFKPASATPAIAAELVRSLDEAGLPAGVLNFVTGSGSTVGDEFVTSEDTDLVTFTGSYAVGKNVHQDATDAGKRVQCEMGGKNPIIVDDSANIDRAVELTIGGAFSGIAGQACSATSRAIVFEDIYDEYVTRLLDRVDELTVGDPLDRDTDLGPKYAQSGLETDLDYIDVGQSEGATLATGGNQLDREGHFIEPTVFTDVEPDMRIAQEEIFGPVLSVLRAGDWEEAITTANNVNYGLTASICTNRLDHAKKFADRIEAGVVKVNQTSSGVELQMPFGGRKDSSTETFKEQGRGAFDFYTHEKAVYLTHYDGT